MMMLSNPQQTLNDVVHFQNDTESISTMCDSRLREPSVVHETSCFKDMDKLLNEYGVPAAVA